MKLRDYTPQETRVRASFPTDECDTVVTCHNCGRTYFLTSDEHGEYDPGELKMLQEKAVSNPEKYIAFSQDVWIETFDIPVQQQPIKVVLGCECDPTKSFTGLLEEHAEVFTKYLRLYWMDEHRKAMVQAALANESIKNLYPPA